MSQAFTAFIELSRKHRWLHCLYAKLRGSLATEVTAVIPLEGTRGFFMWVADTDQGHSFHVPALRQSVTRCSLLGPRPCVQSTLPNVRAMG